MAVPNETPSVIRISRMLNSRIPRPMTPKLSPISVKPAPMFRAGRAEGGIVDSPAAPFTGPIVTSGGGRTDDVPMHVPSGSYVLPADVVSHVGDGNSVAGLKLLTMMFGAPLNRGGAPWGATMPKVVKGAGVREPGIGKPNAPYPAMAVPMPKPGAMTARGGHVEDHGSPTPIMASGGEFVIPPDEVTRRGGGDISKGHKALDAWVLHLRGKAIKTLRGLPGPAK